MFSWYIGGAVHAVAGKSVASTVGKPMTVIAGVGRGEHEGLMVAAETNELA
jgi:hypothetical protein